MKGHHACGFGLGFLAGFIVGAVVVFGLERMPDTGPLRLPSVTMGDKAEESSVPAGGGFCPVRGLPCYIDGSPVRRLLFLWCTMPVDITHPCTQRTAFRIEDAGPMLPDEDDGCAKAMKRWIDNKGFAFANDNVALDLVCEERR